MQNVVNFIHIKVYINAMKHCDKNPNDSFLRDQHLVYVCIKVALLRFYPNFTQFLNVYNTSLIFFSQGQPIVVKLQISQFLFCKQSLCHLFLLYILVKKSFLWIYLSASLLWPISKSFWYCKFLHVICV